MIRSPLQGSWVYETGLRPLTRCGQVLTCWPFGNSRFCGFACLVSSLWSRVEVTMRINFGAQFPS
ncbi:MAG: hypothetical protein CMM01_01260 [Rhodopirellula sp.]|nr:hypothetical protein [Rhodopirellula sp.]